ncbi:nuclear transport factor 2 family protein [Photobacterium sp. SDRW27]|uniref:nuclear transport factor 2 family protein n=1 Tax=Photobacterium obscurum TaxID=2829490 RepID=UPI002244EDB6|nr:nuclear transport factor 2 family protein [Photobacterium obscurum]MCW8327196.1 nuclear transport factor 2 family protein [Photobacterium obscurum]
MNKTAIDTWHQIIETRDPSALKTLLADNVTFHSPVVHTPQVGKAITTHYLTTAFDVLFNESFQYDREVINDGEAVLEFSTEIEGITINGVDMIRWDHNDQIVDFKVMLRPLKAINLVHQIMAAKL